MRAHNVGFHGIHFYRQYLQIILKTTHSRYLRFFHQSTSYFIWLSDWGGGGVESGGRVNCIISVKHMSLSFKEAAFSSYSNSQRVMK